MFRSHPWKFLHGMTFGDSVDLVNTPALAREFLFCEGTPEHIVESCAVRMESESTRAGMDTMFGTLKANAVTTSLLVLGAEQDGSRVEGDISAVARSYRTSAELFPNMGHDMMLEPGWQAVAERIDGWLSGQGL
jgi:hypothetical protein